MCGSWCLIRMLRWGFTNGWVGFKVSNQFKHGLEDSTRSTQMIRIDTDMFREEQWNLFLPCSILRFRLNITPTMVQERLERNETTGISFPFVVTLLTNDIIGEISKTDNADQVLQYNIKSRQYPMEPDLVKVELHTPENEPCIQRSVNAFVQYP